MRRYVRERGEALRDRLDVGSCDSRAGGGLFLGTVPLVTTYPKDLDAASADRLTDGQHRCVTLKGERHPGMGTGCHQPSLWGGQRSYRMVVTQRIWSASWKVTGGARK